MRGTGTPIRGGALPRGTRGSPGIAGGKMGSVRFQIRLERKRGEKK